MRKMVFGILVVALSVLFAVSGWAAETVKISMAGQSPMEHQATKHQFEFKEAIEKQSGGRFEIKVYPANQLGDYTQVYEEIMRGTLEMALINIPSQFDQRLELTYVPYLVENYDQVKTFFAPDGFIVKTLGSIHEKLGVKLLGFNIEGLGGFATTVPVENAADPKAKKNVLLRVPPMDVFKLHADDLGYTTISVPYAELYTALQTGVAQGWSGGPPVLTYLSFRDVIKNYYQYNSHLESECWLINKNLWDSFSPEDQKMFMDVIAGLQAKSTEIAQQDDTEYLEKMREAGIAVNTFSNEELAALADYTRETTWPRLRDRLTPEIMDELAKQYQ